MERDAKDYKESYKNRLEEYHREITRIKSDNDLAIRKETQSLKDEIIDLTIQKNSAEKEVEIIRIAFKNLGFDVKDMKDILKTLSDAVVAKNTVQVIK